MKRHYANLLEDFEAEEIHQFRLHAKKLNALLHLRNAGTEGKKKLHRSKALHAFYEAVGELRNLQLHAGCVLRLCGKRGLAVPHRYLQTLPQKEEAAKLAVRNIALRRGLQAYYRKLVNEAPETVSERAVEDFVARSKHRLFTLLLAGNYDEDCLHDIRKLLKQVLYLWPWVEAEMASLPHSACMDKGACLALCETLGDFRDCCTALRLLDAYSAAAPPVATEALTLHAVSNHTLDEKLRLKKEIVEHLQACVKQLWEQAVLLPLYEYS